MHVVTHRNVEQIVSDVPRDGISFVISPGKAVAMCSSFTSIIVSIIESKSCINMDRSTAAAHVNVAHISVITRISVDTVRVVWSSTIAVVVTSLSVSGPAAHDSMKIALRKVAHPVGELDSPYLCNSLIDIIDISCVNIKAIAGGTLDVWDAVVNFCFILLVPESVSVKVLLVELLSVTCDVTPGEERILFCCGSSCAEDVHSFCPSCGSCISRQGKQQVCLLGSGVCTGWVIGNFLCYSLNKVGIAAASLVQNSEGRTSETAGLSSDVSG
mmetsp:Transcript_1057/g.1501  ORF Transcript_1057/g.1501 Transcript_1057/m.1501 type:complete len:271 (-) Transcript_1057:145-957(-)